MKNKLSRNELIELGQKIINCEGSEEEINEMHDLFNRNVPYLDGANLFFYPENYNARIDNIQIIPPNGRRNS